MLSRKSLFKVIAAFVMVSLTIAPALIGFKCGLSAPDLATNSSNFAALDNLTYTDMLLPPRKHSPVGIPSEIVIPTIAPTEVQPSSIKDSLYGSLLYTIQESDEYSDKVDFRSFPIAPVLKPTSNSSVGCLLLKHTAIAAINTATHFMR